jgi:hypothetical protein
MTSMNWFKYNRLKHLPVNKIGQTNQKNDEGKEYYEDQTLFSIADN